MDDLNAWMAQRINDAVPLKGEWKPSEIAAKLVDELEADTKDRKRFHQWMRENTIRMVHRTINDRHRADRARALRQSKARRLADAAESTDEDALDPFLVPFFVEDTGEHKRLGEMTGPECLSAAAPYRRLAEEHAMRAAFLEAVAKKAGKRHVSEVLTRDQLRDMMRSLGIVEVAA
jgi:hypothetical protein